MMANIILWADMFMIAFVVGVFLWGVCDGRLGFSGHASALADREPEAPVLLGLRASSYMQPLCSPSVVLE